MPCANKNTFITFLLLSCFIYGILSATTPIHGLYNNVAVFEWMIAQWQIPGLLEVSQVLTFLGGTKLSVITFVIIFSLLAYYRCWQTMFMVFITASLVIGSLLLFKLLIASPRPFPEEGVLLGSFPSGHATRVSLIFGLLIIFNLKSHKKALLLNTFYCLIPLLVGVSRVILGQHWLNDILSAYFLTGLILFWCYQLGFKRINEPLPTPQINRVVGIYYGVACIAFTLC